MKILLQCLSIGSNEIQQDKNAKKPIKRNEQVREEKNSLHANNIMKSEKKGEREREKGGRGREGEKDIAREKYTGFICA